MDGVPTDSIWGGDFHLAEYPIDWIRTPNGGYPLGGVSYKLAGYPPGGCILRIEYLPLIGAPVVSPDRAGLRRFFGFRGGFACVSYGMYTTSGGIRHDWAPYGFDMDGFVFILPNLAIGVVGGHR